MNSIRATVITCLLCTLIGQSTVLAQSANRKPERGILGKKAPDWKTSRWYQLPDDKESLNVSDYKGKVLYLYFFQSWCPGCHRIGFPTLQKVSRAFEGNKDVAFVAIQTTFEGHSINTADKLKEVADRYKLKIPFGQSSGKSGTPDIMRKYRTGGTPWVVVLDPQGRVVFNDFHIDPDQAIKGIRKLTESNTRSRPNNG